MIHDLDKRKEWWSANSDIVWLDDESTPTQYLDSHIHLFKDKRVLEIGPGRGRQKDKVCDITKSYTVADISEKFLKEESFQDVSRHLMTGYEPFGDFDLIHFWFVLHHVLHRELEDFFEFLYNSLMKDGLILFNFPSGEFSDHQIADDGIKTSLHKRELIDTVTMNFFRIVDEFKGVDFPEVHHTTYLMQKREAKWEDQG